MTDPWLLVIAGAVELVAAVAAFVALVRVRARVFRDNIRLRVHAAGYANQLTQLQSGLVRRGLSAVDGDPVAAALAAIDRSATILGRQFGDHLGQNCCGVDQLGD